MRAVRFHSLGEFTCDTLAIPEPQGEEILVEVAACGICGSDIPRVFSLGTKVAPVTLGHEFSGIVRKVGDPKNKPYLGKRVAVFNIIPCFFCAMCRTGNYAQCENISYLGTRVDGGFADYCLVPSAFHLVVSEKESLPIECLALTEPAAVALHALRRSGLQPAQSVLIIGAGPIGILAARWAKYFGAAPVLLTDIIEEKVRFAQQRGCHAVSSTGKAVKEETARLTRGQGFDIVIEGSGSSGGLCTAIESLRHFGTLVLLGNPAQDTVIPLQHHSALLRKEATIKAVWNSYFSDYPVNEWKYVVHAMEAGTLLVEDLITHRSSLEELPTLFQKISCQEISVCKAIYQSNP